MEGDPWGVLKGGVNKFDEEICDACIIATTGELVLLCSGVFDG